MFQPNAAARIGLMAITAGLPSVMGLSLLPWSATGPQMSLLTLAVVALVVTRHIAGSPERIESGLRYPEHRDRGEGSDSAPLAEPAAFSPSTAGIEQVDSERCSQWMQRSISADGVQETIEGTETVRFEAGRKYAVVHIAFCPPLAEAPQVECEPVEEDSGIRWKLAVVEPYGMRIDLRRSGDVSAPVKWQLGWFATSPVRSNKAA